MIAQPATATPPATGAIQAGASPPGAGAAPDELLAVFSAVAAAPFSQALLALSAATDSAAAPSAKMIPQPMTDGQPAGAATAARPAQPDGCAALPDGGAALPADLLLALFPPDTAAAAPLQATRSAGTGVASDAQAAAGKAVKVDDPAVAPAPTVAPDPGAALLAAVLQWLQQQGALAPRPAPTAEAPEPAAGSAQVSGDGAALRSVAVITAPILRDAGGSQRSGARTATVPDASALAIVPAASGAALAGQLADRGDPDARGAAGERPTAPPAIKDNNATATVMDMASALRAASTATASPVERSVAVPVHERHWPQALAAQLLILSSDKVQAATLRLSPEHLGPVEVHIDLQDANVNVTFTAAHVETRAALEQAMPQLRAVLAGAGLTLGQATVQQQARRESQNSTLTPRTSGDAGEQPEALAAVARALGMIDEYV